MRISVVIPTYNQASTISETLDSVFNQTRKADEVIVVIDGSKDGTLAVVENYPVTIINQINKGLPSARNAGIMSATGDYIQFLDSDDMLKPNCLDRVEQVAQETGADIIAPSFQEFGISQREVILAQNPTLKDFAQANMIGYFSMIKREALLECGGYSPKMLYGFEDYAIWFDLLGRGKKLVTIPEMLVMYRTKKNSMIHSANAHGLELMAQIHKDFPDAFI